MIVPLLLTGLALILAYIGSRKELTRPQLLFVALFFGIGAIGVIFPNSSMRVAGWLNVGRGADLLLYFSVLCGVMIAANFYFRFRETERKLTEIVRQMAIVSPQYPAASGNRE